MVNTTLLVIAFSAIGATLYAQTSEEKEVAAVVEALRKAMVDADKTVLEKLTAGELSYGHSSGTIEDKATFIESLVSGKSDFVSITLEDQTIQVNDGMALVRHKLRGETQDKGKPPGTVNIGILLVWRKEKKEWKLVGRQAYKL